MRLPCSNCGCHDNWTGRRHSDWISVGARLDHLLVVQAPARPLQSSHPQTFLLASNDHCLKILKAISAKMPEEAGLKQPTVRGLDR